MIRFIIEVYIFIIIIDVVLSYIPQFRNEKWAKQIKKIAGYSLDPIRNVLPQDLPFDVSPIVVIILLQMIIYLW